MAFEQGDVPNRAQTSGDEARSALSNEYIQLASLPGDTEITGDGDRHNNILEASEPADARVAQTQLSPEIEAMKRQYPVIGELFEEYSGLVNGGSPEDYLKAEPKFRKAVTDSDTSHRDLEQSLDKRLKDLGPGLPGLVKDYTDANKAMEDALKALPPDEQNRIIRNMQIKQIPMSKAAGQHRELAEAAAKVEKIFKDNTPTFLKLTEMQGELALSTQQRQYAREMHGDTLEHGAGAAEPGQRRQMLAEKARIDQEVKDINEGGVPNIMDYIKD